VVAQFPEDVLVDERKIVGEGLRPEAVLEKVVQGDDLGAIECRKYPVGPQTDPCLDVATTSRVGKPVLGLPSQQSGFAHADLIVGHDTRRRGNRG
jgi:hypothetical protein